MGMWCTYIEAIGLGLDDGHAMQVMACMVGTHGTYVHEAKAIRPWANLVRREA